MAYGNLLTDVVQSSTTGTAPVFKDGNGTETGQLCRAWASFASGGTIYASFNVTSITRNGTGDYTVNFTNAMSDANYSVVIGNKYGSAGSMSGAYSMGTMEVARTTTAIQTTSVRVWGSYGVDTVLYDRERIFVTVFR